MLRLAGLGLGYRHDLVVVGDDADDVIGGEAPYEEGGGILRVLEWRAVHRAGAVEDDPDVERGPLGALGCLAVDPQERTDDVVGAVWGAVVVEEDLGLHRRLRVEGLGRCRAVGGPRRSYG